MKVKEIRDELYVLTERCGRPCNNDCPFLVHEPYDDCKLIALIRELDLYLNNG